MMDKLPTLTDFPFPGYLPLKLHRSKQKYRSGLLFFPEFSPTTDDECFQTWSFSKEREHPSQKLTLPKKTNKAPETLRLGNYKYVPFSVRPIFIRQALRV